MKRTILIIFGLLVISFGLKAQIYQNPLLFGKKENRVHILYDLGIPNDTIPVPLVVKGYPHIAAKGTNLFLWDTAAKKWNLYSSGISSFYDSTLMASRHWVTSRGYLTGVPTIDQVLQQDNALYGDRNIDGNYKSFQIAALYNFGVDNSYGDAITIDTIGLNATGVGRTTLQSLNKAEITTNYYGLKLKTYTNKGLYFDVDSLGLVARRRNSILALDDSATGKMKWKSPQDYAALLSPYFITHTFSNGLTEAAGVVKLGGTLTEATTTIMGNNKQVYFDSLKGFIIKSRNSDFPNTAYVSVNNEEGVNLVHTNASLNVADNIVLNTNNRVEIRGGDTVSLNSNNIKIPILPYTLSATSKKIMLRDTSTGLVQNIDPALLSGATQTLQQVTDAGNTTTNTIELGSVDPALSLKQSTSNQQYLLRVGVGTGISSQVFNLYNQSASKHLITGSANRIIIGNPTDAFTNSTLYLKGYGANGTNLDVQPDSSILDEGNIEIMASDYGLGQGIALRQWGNVGAASTVMGYQKKNMGVLDFTNDFNIIRTNTNHSLRFGTNNVERMILDSTGKLHIGNNTDYNVRIYAYTAFSDGTGIMVTPVSGTSANSIRPDGLVLYNTTNSILLQHSGSNFGITGGNVGIGTQSPDSTLDVTGSLKVGTNTKLLGKVHAPNLAAGNGTKAVRWDATNGFVLADTTTGGSGSTVTGGSFNPDDNYLTLNQSGAGNIGIRMRPSYIINDDTSPDSTGVKVNDSTYRTKSITVAASNSKVTVTPTRTTKNNTFTVGVNEANFSGIPQTAVSNLSDSLNNRLTGTVRIGTSVYNKFSDGSKTFAYYDSLGSGTGGGSRLFIQFEVGVTSFAPGNGDSILKHSYLSSRKSLVYREGEFQHSTSQILQSHDSLKFIPALTTNERVFIELIDTSNVTMLALEDNSTPPASDYLLDDYTAYHAFSLMRLKTGEDSSVLVRRSTDDAYQVIGFTTDGFFDTTAYKSFIGANTGYVQTVYNQAVVAGFDAIQYAYAEQPTIQLNVFGNKPAIIFDGTNDALSTASSDPYSIVSSFVVDSVGVGSGVANGSPLYFSSAGWIAGLYPWTDEGIYESFGSTTRHTCGTPSVAIRAKHLYYVRGEADTWQNYVNTTMVNLDESNTVNAASSVILGYGGGGSFFKGALAEAIIMGDVSRTNVSNRINSTYSIY